jgi:hypothetical protein
MYYLPPADRGYDVASPVTVYRLIGRRPSAVYVDETMTPGVTGRDENRLSDLVYWRTLAEAGDQIQERPGTTLLVTAGDRFYAIHLSPPEPLRPETAFTHAQAAADADRQIAARLLAEGKLTEAAPRRVKIQPARATEKAFGQDDPLVIDQLPDDFVEAAIDPRRGRGHSWNRRGRSA